MSTTFKDGQLPPGTRIAWRMRDPECDIELVDAPDVPRDPDSLPPGIRPSEFQRTYKIDEPARTHTVRIRMVPGNMYDYLIENLVTGRWHVLLTGSTVERNTIDFEAALERAAKVLVD